MPGPSRGSRSPGFSPPHWVRFGRRPNFAPVIGGLAPLPVQIPYLWLTAIQPLRSRPDKPLTTAAVTQTGGPTARAQDADSLGAFGDNLFQATLDTATRGDTQALADWVISYYATEPTDVPRARFPSLLLRLNARTLAEKQRIMGVTIGTRISITGAPATWPQGATEQVVEGIRQIRGEAADVVWNTAPVVGATPGTAGVWFRLDSSVLDGTHVVLF